MSVARCRVESVPPEALLEFAAAWPRHNGIKDLAIRRDLGITPPRFYQLLGRAAKAVEGIAADPRTARRVRARAVRL